YVTITTDVADERITTDGGVAVASVIVIQCERSDTGIIVAGSVEHHRTCSIRGVPRPGVFRMSAATPLAVFAAPVVRVRIPAPMASEIIEKLRSAVRDVPDFPKKGIVFKDITPVLNDPVLFRASINLFLEQCRRNKLDKIVGIDARGFLFGSAVAYELGLGFVP